MLRRHVLSYFVAISALGASASAADAMRQGFDEGATSWRIEYDAKALRPIQHIRQSTTFHKGHGAELIQCQAGAGGVTANFVHSLTPALAIEDLTLSVWMRSSEAGHQLRLRLVFPGETDPETGQPLTALLAGDRYVSPNVWQQLSCKTTNVAVQDALRRTRARYRLSNGDISAEGLYVDQAIVAASCGSKGGPFEILFDDLHFSPIVEPAHPGQILTASIDVPVPDPPVEFRLNHLSVEGEPFFPRMGTLYSDSEDAVRVLADTGVNTAWIMDYRDDDLLQQLRTAGLWATAIPPRAEDGRTGEILDSRTAGVMPFGPETRPILFWNLGPRIPQYTLDQLIGWVGQIHAADAIFDRPILADVKDGEYAFSNHVDMLAVSRHITNTAIPYEHYRNWLRTRRSEAFLNTFFWTWVQTEPDAKAVRARSAAGTLPLVLEPEQIRLQVYAALQSGCRGIGYWNTIPFEADGVGTEERRLALTRLNLELELLEPLLATGGRPGQTFKFQIKESKPGSDGRRVQPSYHQVTITGPKAAETPFAESERPPGVAEAVAIKTDLGPLLIATWYGDGAQFCPGRMAENNVQIIVPGVDETAAAWLISPAGVKRLAASRVTGGRRITLERFDQTATVLFTSDTAVIQRLQRVASRMTQPAAQATLELARAKRQRVANVHQQLQGLAPPLNDGPAMLRSADNRIAAAEAAASRQDFSGALEAADEALQALRILQRAHWEYAVRPFASPLASPHAVCFSTLPDHFRLINKVGRSIMNPSQEANLLPSGSFENEQAVAELWQLVPSESPRIYASGALLAKGPKQGQFALQLVVGRKDAQPIKTADSSVTMLSPPMPVTAGQVLHISGWVQVVGRPIDDDADGATLHDNLLGPSAGLRWTKTKGWEQFELLREVPEDGTLELTLGLKGEGEVLFDDVRVIPHDPHLSVAEQPGRNPVR